MNVSRQRSPISARRSTAWVAILIAVLALPSTAIAQNHSARSNTPGFIQKAKDLGPTDPTAVIEVTAWLNLHNENALDGLVKSQHQKGSANYQKWITQAEFNSSFGPTAQEVNAVQNFLAAHKLTVLEVAESNMYVKVQGTVADVQKTFHVQIDKYSFNGQTYRSNKADPSVNGPAGAHIAAVTGLAMRLRVLDSSRLTSPPARLMQRQSAAPASL